MNTYEENFYQPVAVDSEDAPSANGASWLPSLSKKTLLKHLLIWFLFGFALHALLTYREKYENEWDMHKQSLVYKAKYCKDADTRVEIGPTFDRCPEAEKVLRRNPTFEAFVKMLKVYNICGDKEDGRCMLVGVDFFSWLPMLFGASAVFGPLPVLYAAVQLLMWLAAQFQEKDRLPLYKLAVHKASARQAHKAD